MRLALILLLEILPVTVQNEVTPNVVNAWSRNYWELLIFYDFCLFEKPCIIVYIVIYFELWSDMLGAKSITTHFLDCWNLAKSTRCSNRLLQEPPYLIQMLQSKRNATETNFSQIISQLPHHFQIRFRLTLISWILDLLIWPGSTVWTPSPVGLGGSWTNGFAKMVRVWIGGPS